MSSGSARRGRRDNGLDAAEYAAAGDVDPRVGEHLLDVLALQGIAAYLQPAVDLNPVTRSAIMPSRPTDRLFVDRLHLRTARDYLAQVAEPAAPTRAESPPPLGTPVPATESAPAGGEDDAWAQIIAGYDADVDATVASWPEAENLAEEKRRADAEEEDDPGERRPPPALQDARPSLLISLDTFGADLPDDEDDDDGYTPPPPPPLPRPSKYAVLGVLAILAGFVLFLKPTLLPIDPDVSMLIGFAAILAGFVTLVWRLRPGDDEDDYDPDDGARV